MALTVLSIAFPFAPVGPKAVGGAEQILGELDHALVSAGHNSLVVACGGSRPAGKLFSIPPPQCELLEDADRTQCRKQVQAAIDRAVSASHLDLVHMHGLDFYEYTLPPTIPLVVTLHMPIALYPPQIWTSFQSRAQFCCVSESQRRTCPPELQHALVVENGVTLPTTVQNTRKGDFALALGRICPAKNAHAALEAGTLAGTRVLLGGQVFAYREHRQYFHEKIEPLLRRKNGDVNHEFLGPLSPARRQDLLRGAKCLLHPTLAPESSSLIAMEALAAGTPVIAYRSGALAEIVEDGVTGFLVDSVEQMAEAVRNVHNISSDACRTAAERRFSKERMLRRYFDLYRLLTDRSRTEAYA